MTPVGEPSQTSGAAVETYGLVKRYGPLAALDGINLRVDPGESVLLLGPNGAGKTTLLRAVAGLIRPSAGTVHVYGAPHGGAGGSGVRRRLGLLSHHTYLYDHLTAIENLEFYARLYDLDDPASVALAALDEAGLADRASEQVLGFSRGMQQRLAIARALLHQPDLILFDEPFTGLDRDAAKRLRSVLIAARREGRTCIIATHDFAAGLAAAGRVIILADGRLRVDRPTADLDAAGLDRLFQDATRLESPPLAGAI